NLEQIKDNKCRVGLIHYKPELLQDTSNGILVEKLLDPMQQDGKIAALYVNIDTKEPYYEYEEIPPTKEDMLKDEIIKLKIQQETADNITADLAYELMMLKGAK
ncbi:hypothetical protein, partial [Metaclostridioides mangenotii]